MCDYVADDTVVLPMARVGSLFLVESDLMPKPPAHPSPPAGAFFTPQNRVPMESPLDADGDFTQK